MPNYVSIAEQISVALVEKAEDEIKQLALYPVAFVFPREHTSAETPGDLTVYAVRQSNSDERGVAFRTAVVNCIVRWYHDHSEDGGMLYKAAGGWRLFCYGRHWGPVIAEEALVGQLGESVTGQVDRIINNALHQEDMDRAFYRVDNKPHK